VGAKVKAVNDAQVSTQRKKCLAEVDEQLKKGSDDFKRKCVDKTASLEWQGECDKTDRFTSNQKD
jgi:hypothetical protein